MEIKRTPFAVANQSINTQMLESNHVQIQLPLFPSAARFQIQSIRCTINLRGAQLAASGSQLIGRAHQIHSQFSPQWKQLHSSKVQQA